jgi:mycothiol synthase
MEEFFRQLIADGYQVRPASFDDLPQVVAMFNAAEVERTGAGDWSIEFIRQNWGDPGFELATSTRLVAAPDGSIVGLVELWDDIDPPATPWIGLRVHPQWHSAGIGCALVAWVLETSKRALDRLPADARLAPKIAAPATHRPSIELFDSMGMTPCRYSWRMLIDLQEAVPEPQWPAGIQVRTLRYPEDLEATYRAEQEAFEEHWGYVKSSFEEGFKQWKNQRFEASGLKPELWFLALEGDQIAGQINCMERAPMDAAKGWIHTLGVRKAYRRRGIGQALLLHTFRALQQQGVPAAYLFVDAANKTGATRLYQRVGMRVELEITYYELELRPGRELAVVD